MGVTAIAESGYHAGVFCMVVFTLCIHEYNVIDRIA